jgi:hypothetical protein
MTVSGDSCGVEALTSKLSCTIRLIFLHIGSERCGLKNATDSVRQFGDCVGTEDAAMQKAMLAGFLAFAYVLPESAGAAELRQETTEAFNQYVRMTEDRMTKEMRDGRTFLWVDTFPERQRDKLYTQLRQGNILIEQLETLENEKRVRVPNGLIHHWIALGFVPGVTLQQVLALMQDYDHHQEIYKPDVLRSRLLNADGSYFKVYLRLHQKAIITAVFNAEFDVSYFPLDENRTHSRSYSTRIAELENPDRLDEREKPVGNDRGFLWRLYSYWRFQEKDRGVYVQLESVALSRSVPVLLAWVVNPLLKSIPREYLSRLLISTRAALTNKSAAGSFGASPSMKQLSTQFSFVAPSSAAMQNKGHSTVILAIQERTICAPQKS